MIGSSYGSSVIGSFFLSWILGSCLGSSILVFRYAVCHQLHQELEGVLHWFSVFYISIATDVLIISLGNLMDLPEILLTRAKSKKSKQFIFGFWQGSKYASAESPVFRSIHPEVFRKIAFLKGFSKFLEESLWLCPFRRSYRPKTGLFHRCCPVKQFLLMFS